jgi:hypothetical protein
MISIGYLSIFGGISIYLIFWLTLFIVQLLFFPAPVSIFARVIVFFVAPLVCVSLTSSLPSLTSPDSYAFLSNYNSYSLKEMCDEVFAGGDSLSVGMVSARFTFPIMLKILTGDALSLNPAVVGLVNLNIWLMAAFALSHIVFRYMHIEICVCKKRLVDLTFIAFCLFPSPMYWIIALNKDIFSVSLPVLAAYFFLGRSYVLMLLLLFMGSIVRPYSVVIFMSIVLIAYPNRWRSYVVLFGVILFMALYSKLDSFLFMNAFLGFLFFFASPNPFSPGNWKLYEDTGTWAFSPAWLTVESLILFLAFLCAAISFVLNRRSRADLKMLMLSIFLVSSAVVFVGYFRMNEIGIDFSIGNFGDNLVRKKMSAWPLISIFVAYVIEVTLYGRKKA